MTVRFVRLSLIVAMLLICLAAGAAPARPLTPIEGLEALRKSFAGVSDFTADIIQEKQLSLMKRKLVSTGIVRFKKPGLFFMEINPPHASRLLLKDTTLSLYLVKEKSTQQITLPPEQSLQSWFAFLARPVTALPEGVEVQAEQQRDGYTLTITPRARGQVRALTLALHDDGRLKKLVIEEQNGDRTAITFSRFRKNTGLTESDFQLE